MCPLSNVKLVHGDVPQEDVPGSVCIAVVDVTVPVLGADVGFVGTEVVIEPAALTASLAGPVLVTDDDASAELSGLVDEVLAEAVGCHLHELAGSPTTDDTLLLGLLAGDDALGAELGQQDHRVTLTQMDGQLVVEVINEVTDALADASCCLLDTIAVPPTCLLGFGSQAVRLARQPSQELRAFVLAILPSADVPKHSHCLRRGVVARRECAYTRIDGDDASLRRFLWEHAHIGWDGHIVAFRHTFVPETEIVLEDVWQMFAPFHLHHTAITGRSEHTSQNASAWLVYPRSLNGNRLSTIARAPVLQLAMH